jgi:hypothetical protein
MRGLCPPSASAQTFWKGLARLAHSGRFSTVLDPPIRHPARTGYDVQGACLGARVAHYKSGCTAHISPVTLPRLDQTGNAILNVVPLIFYTSSNNDCSYCCSFNVPRSLSSGPFSVSGRARIHAMQALSVRIGWLHRASHPH